MKFYFALIFSTVLIAGQAFAKTYYYEIDSDNSESAEIHQSQLEFLERFKADTLAAAGNVDPIFLAKRQIEFFKKINFRLDVYEQILEKEIGILRDLNTTEEYLLDRHFSVNDRKSEFCAFLLSLRQKEKVLVESQNTRGTVTCDKVFSRALELKSQGWTVDSHFHNHPFLFD